MRSPAGRRRVDAGTGYPDRMRDEDGETGMSDTTGQGGAEPQQEGEEPESEARPTAAQGTDDTESQTASNEGQVRQDGWPGIS